MICISDNNAVIINDYGRFQDLILLFKIHVGTEKNFLSKFVDFWAQAIKKGLPSLA